MPHCSGDSVEQPGRGGGGGGWGLRAATLSLLPSLGLYILCTGGPLIPHPPLMSQLDPHLDIIDLPHIIELGLAVIHGHFP